MVSRLVMKYFELLNNQADRMSVLSRIGNMSNGICWKYGQMTIHSDLQQASKYRSELRWVRQHINLLATFKLLYFENYKMFHFLVGLTVWYLQGSATTSSQWFHPEDGQSKLSKCQQYNGRQCDISIANGMKIRSRILTSQRLKKWEKATADAS
jgi:hypothetical protein